MRSMLTVHRKAYTRKPFTAHRNGKTYHVKSTRVPATTFRTTDRGKPGRNMGYFKPLKKGTLGGKGFFTKSAKARHTRELKDVRRYGYQSTQGKLSQEIRFRPSNHVVTKAKADKRYLARMVGGKGSYGPRRRR